MIRFFFAFIRRGVARVLLTLTYWLYGTFGLVQAAQVTSVRDLRGNQNIRAGLSWDKLLQDWLQGLRHLSGGSYFKGVEQLTEALRGAYELSGCDFESHVPPIYSSTWATNIGHLGLVRSVWLSKVHQQFGQDGWA